MDDLDRGLLKALAVNARASGAALAEKLGIAESTVSHRLKRLQADGLIRGYRTDIDLDALGVTIQALIAIRLGKLDRDEVDAFREAAPHWPGVLALFHVGGANDYLLHVAAKNAAGLRDFVLRYLATHPAVAHTETNIIFEHVRGEGIEQLLS